MHCIWNMFKHELQYIKTQNKTYLKVYVKPHIIVKFLVETLLLVIRQLKR